MADRLTPPVRYPRYGEEPVRGNSTGKNRKTKEKSENSREFFHKSKIMDYWMHGGLDVPFFALVMVLLAIGLVMLLSASYPTAYFNGENSYSFFLKQACFAVVGVAVMLFVSKIDYKIFKQFSLPLYILGVMLLFIVLFYHTNIQSSAGEAFKRYIPLGPITFQPSEIGKFSLVVCHISAVFLTESAHSFMAFLFRFVLSVFIACLFLQKTMCQAQF